MSNAPRDTAPPPHANAYLPIELNCAAALSRDFSPDDEMNRSKVVMEASSRMPAVAYFGSRFGEKWYVDIVAFPHNAIRRQLYDAYIMANSLGTLTLDVSDSDLDRVYAWLGTLDLFIKAIFNAEHRFLYRLIDKHVTKASTPDGERLYLPESISVLGRQPARANILDLLSKARKTRDVATGEIPGKIKALRYALDEFGKHILHYFSAMETLVPKLFKRSMRPRTGNKENERYQKNLFEFLLQQDHGAMLAALLMQCIESRSKRHDFVQRHLKRRERDSFKQHVKMVEAKHMQLASTFETVATKYTKRFNVKKFLEVYRKNADQVGNETLALLGDTALPTYDEYDAADEEPDLKHLTIDEENYKPVNANGNEDQFEEEDDDDFINVVVDVDDGKGTDDDVIDVVAELPVQMTENHADVVPA